ncbi:LPD29 domain-containing protein [Paraburkholderia sp. BR10936]|uniref:LPD29 domain-containing protein n=1 Tax=Paraburkholderia sp. BR10936 TaxID=3236993 RepID=UPI0034D1C234
MGLIYIGVAETAKLLRKALKEAFPGVKFGVRSHKYAGGASIGVAWRDGPSEALVEAITDRFRGSYFDGMIDYQGSRYAMIDGQMVRFGADYIQTRRSFSRAMVERFVERLAPGCVVCGDDDYGWGITWADNESARRVSKALHRHSDRLRIMPSPTAARIIYCGNDGYSDVGALAVDDDEHDEGKTKQ